MNPNAQILGETNSIEIANISQFAHKLGATNTSINQFGLPDETQFITDYAPPRGNSNSSDLRHGLQICAIVCS